jgi:hypothetical protein
MQPFAEELGDDEPPFVWDPDRRFGLRAVLDAAYFLLYGLERDDVEYALRSFRAFRNKEPDLFQATKEKILSVYDELKKAEETGEPFQSALTPPPGAGARQRPGRSTCSPPAPRPTISSRHWMMSDPTLCSH